MDTEKDLGQCIRRAGTEMCATPTYRKNGIIRSFLAPSTLGYQLRHTLDCTPDVGSFFVS